MVGVDISNVCLLNQLHCPELNEVGELGSSGADRIKARLLYAVDIDTQICNYDCRFLN